VSQGLRISEVVYRNELNIGVVERCAQDIAPDAPKPVNAYFDRHVASEREDEDTRMKLLGGPEQKILTGECARRQITERAMRISGWVRPIPAKRWSPHHDFDSTAISR
jgi:hypothetical protein